MMHRPYFNTVTMVGESSMIDCVVRETIADIDAGLFATLVGRNANISDQYNHDMTMYGTNHDVMIGTIQMFIRDHPQRWTFGFRTRHMPLEFLSAIARRFYCTVLYHAESRADVDSWSQLYVTYNRRGLVTYSGSTPPDEMINLPIYQSEKSKKHHDRILND
jgi:hypothetical protein